MIRRYGAVPIAGQHYIRRPGAYAILPNAGQLLLTVQAGERVELQLPGGGIDPGESAIQALHREVFEETGWRIASPRKLGAFRRFTYMPEYDQFAEKVCHIYLAQPIRRYSAPSEPGHLAVWVDIEEAINDLFNDGDADFVARVSRSIF